MLSTTTELRNRILSAASTDKKIELLSDAGKGKDMIVTGCGPALNFVNPKDLGTVANENGMLVCAIKESLNWWTDLWQFPDFHVTSNYVSSHATIVLNHFPLVFYLLHPEEEVKNPNAIVDIPLRITKAPPKLKYADRAISRTRSFDTWLFSKRSQREYGPTIFPTVVIYLAIHLGVRNLYTLGIDMTGIGHYYESEEKIAKKCPSCKDASLVEQSWFIHAAADWRIWMAKHGVCWSRIKTTSHTNLGMIPEVDLLAGAKQ